MLLPFSAHILGVISHHPHPTTVISKSNLYSLVEIFSMHACFTFLWPFFYFYLPQKPFCFPLFFFFAFYEVRFSICQQEKQIGCGWVGGENGKDTGALREPILINLVINIFANVISS